MGAIAGRPTFGLYTNGQAQSGDNTNFTGYSHSTSDALSGDGCFAMSTNVYGSTILGNEFIPVDTSKYYIHSVSMKTYQRNYNNNLGSGHIGFACYDENFNFIDLRNCGDLGNTTLSRAASPGDSAIYLTSDSGWFTGSTVYNSYRAYQRGVMFFPSTSPYSTAHTYTRVQRVTYYSMTQTAQGDWELLLDSNSGSQKGSYNATTMPNVGYSLPAGTPVSRAQAGGTFNYAHGAPIYPETWTTYTTPPFSGENRNSSYPFRYGTKYIKYMNLRNYNYRTETSGDSARYYIDNIMLLEVPPPSPVQEAAGANFRSEFNNSALRSRLSSVPKFKRPRRGGQSRKDFFGG